MPRFEIQTPKAKIILVVSSKGFVVWHQSEKYQRWVLDASCLKTDGLVAISGEMLGAGPVNGSINPSYVLANPSDLLKKK